MNISEITSNLKPLRGSEKQVAWADQIRAKFFDAGGMKVAAGKTFQERSSAPLAKVFAGKSDLEAQQMIFTAFQQMANLQSAAWWIDNRHSMASHIEGLQFFLCGLCGDVAWYESKVA